MITKNIFILSTAIATVLSAMAISTSSAAVINWGPATNITGDSNVITGRPVVGAFNVGDGPSAFAPYPSVPATTVNGVTFNPFVVNSSAAPTFSAAQASNGVTFTLATTNSIGFLSDNTAYGSPLAPFSTLTPAYQSLLRSATSVGGDNFTLTMSGLTVGQNYTFQWWANTSGPGSQNHSATSVNSVTLNDNTTGVEGGRGQFAIGTFTADAASQVILFSPSPLGPGNFSQINAFQLAIPEPTTALFGLALFGVCASRRRSGVAKA